MIKLTLALFLGLIIGAAGIWFFALRPQSGGAPGDKSKDHSSAEPRVVHTNEETCVRLDEKARELAGLATAELHKQPVPLEVKGYGRVLDPTPLAALVVELEAARAALDASQKDYNRLKGLHAQDQNVSTHVVEAAEAAWKKDEIALHSAELKLLSAWGKPVSERTDLSSFARALAGQEIALVRLDLPLGEPPGLFPAKVRVARLGEDEHSIEGRILGPVASVDPQFQGRGFLCLLETNAFSPGTIVTGWLGFPGEPIPLFVVPSSALVRHEGGTFVFTSSNDLFCRKSVRLLRPLQNGWAVDGDLKPGDRVVTEGAQQLLAEELKAQSSEE